MTRNFRPIPRSDGCAARRIAAHTAALAAFYATFGDVQDTEFILRQLSELETKAA